MTQQRLTASYAYNEQHRGEVPSQFSMFLVRVHGPTRLFWLARAGAFFFAGHHHRQQNLLAVRSEAFREVRCRGQRQNLAGVVACRSCFSLLEGRLSVTDVSPITRQGLFLHSVFSLHLFSRFRVAKSLQLQ